MFPYHCNKCFRVKEMELTTLELYMSRCGHIVCSNCKQSACVMCARPFKPILVTEASGSMAALFENPLQSYRNFQKVLKFNVMQENNLMHYFANVFCAERLAIRAQQKGYAKLDVRFNANEEHEKGRIKKLKEYLLNVESNPMSSYRKSSRKRYDSGMVSDATLGVVAINCPTTPTLSSLASSGKSTKASNKDNSARQRYPPFIRTDFSL